MPNNEKRHPFGKDGAPNQDKMATTASEYTTATAAAALARATAAHLAAFVREERARGRPLPLHAYRLLAFARLLATWLGHFAAVEDASLKRRCADG